MTEKIYFILLCIMSDHNKATKIDNSDVKILDLILCKTKEYEKKQNNKKNKIREHIFFYFIIIFICIIICGTLGYMILFGLSWIDAFYNASLILSAISIEVKAESTIQKIFISTYSLFSVLILLSVANAVTEKLLSIFEDND